MSVETDMEAFLPGALNTLVGTAFACEENSIYYDVNSRYQRDFTEILISFGGNPHVDQEAGDLKRFLFNIELFKATHDPIQNIADAARIERFLGDNADTIVKKYHGIPDEFMVSGSLNVLVDSVVCQRLGPIEWDGPDEDDNRYKAYVNIRLEIQAYEEP